MSVHHSHDMQSLSALVHEFRNKISSQNQEEIAFRSIVEALEERGVAMLLILLAAPMALPLPVPPGINVLLASPLIILTLHLLIGRKTVWLPQSLLSRRLNLEKILSFMESLEHWSKKLELLVKPRLTFLVGGGVSRIVGLLGVVMALTVCIPLPLTNTVPSFGIVLMSVGIVMHDGLAIIVGAFIGICWVLLLVIAFLFFGSAAIDMIKEFI